VPREDRSVFNTVLHKVERYKSRASRKRVRLVWDVRLR